MNDELPTVPDPVGGRPGPDHWLDALCQHPEWDESRRDAAFDALVARFDPETLAAAARARLNALDGGDGEAILRLLEAFGTPEDFRALADALARQPDLAPERAWEALTVLDAAGCLDEVPELAERYEELLELMDEGDAFDELARHLDVDPDSLTLALQTLDRVEPAERVELIAGLAGRPATVGLVEFLRLLAFAPELSTRRAALTSLATLDPTDPGVLGAWTVLAAEHPDPAVVAQARERLPQAPGGPGEAQVPATTNGPWVVEGRVGGIDRAGRGRIVLVAQTAEAWTIAAFDCDLLRGVVGVDGQDCDDPDRLGTLLDEWTGGPGAEVVVGVPEVAVALLAGVLTLNRAQAPLALRLWLERTVGRGFRPRPLAAAVEGADPAGLPAGTVAAQSEQVLAALPDWRDESDLCRELAAEVVLRGDDPRRDAGAVRLLFERRLRDRLDAYGRRLLWMSAVWRAGGSEALADAAASLACGLADPQHAVPGHPLIAGLATRSLAAAAEALARDGLGRIPGRIGGSGA